MIVMSREQWLGIIRHILTFAGGWVVAQGIISEAELVEVIGALMTLVGLVWSAKAPEKKAVEKQQ